MDKLESMVLEAETVSALMIQMADDDVGDTSFAVMSDLGENGTEHDCDLGVHETALRASAVIDALLAELEAKDSQFDAEIRAWTQKYVNAMARIADLESCSRLEYTRRIERENAELKAKLATPVRLPGMADVGMIPALKGTNGETALITRNGVIKLCAERVRAAGFKCVGDEQ